MPTRARARQVALGSGAVALVALVGGGVLLVLPSTQTDTRTLQVTQQGQFSYTGAAESGHHVSHRASSRPATPSGRSSRGR